MNRRIIWSLGVSFVGLLLAQKQTYWYSASFTHDIFTSALGVLGGGIIGYLLGCIAEDTSDERHRRVKVLYWLLVMTVFGMFLAFGKGVPLSTTLVVLGSTLAIGLVAGLTQYFLQRPKVPVHTDRQSNA